MSDPRSLLETAMVASDDVKVDQLLAVAEASEADPVSTTAEKLELDAVVKSELARLGANPISDAFEAVAEAERVGHAGWPSYYFARALLQHEMYQEVLEALAGIPEGFFEERDLLWRKVHCWELAAIAELELGHEPDARNYTDRIAAALATRGDSGDLAAPVDLVRRLIRRIQQGHLAVERSLLDVIANSIDIDDWFDETLVADIEQALA